MRFVWTLAARSLSCCIRTGLASSFSMFEMGKVYVLALPPETMIRRCAPPLTTSTDDTLTRL